MTISSTSSDIFEILDIEEREDTYSRLLVHILQRSPGLRQRLLQHAFGDHAPSAEPAMVTLRHHLGDAGVVDVLMLGPKDAPRPWALFIESKLFSGEHSNQTKKYLAAIQAMAAPDGQASGIFLTIAGDSAQEPKVKPLTHRELTGWILAHMSDLRDHPALCIAAEAYARRAQVPLPERADGGSDRAFAAQADVGPRAAPRRSVGPRRRAARWLERRLDAHRDLDSGPGPRQPGPSILATRLVRHGDRRAPLDPGQHLRSSRDRASAALRPPAATVALSKLEAADPPLALC